MKNNLLIICLLIVLFPLVLAAQDSEYVAITAARFSERVADTYLKEYRIAGMKVDRKGVAQAEDGYDMLYLPNDGKVIFKPAKISVEEIRNDYDTKDVPGGTMFCLCDASSDDCEITVSVVDNTVHYFCDGGCGCGSFIIFDVMDNISDIRMQGANDWTPIDK